jgi:hypothetical protein
LPGWRRCAGRMYRLKTLDDVELARISHQSSSETEEG